MNFLISNDDGINSPSLLSLARILSDLGNVYCCAPASEQSGVSQAFTFLKPIEVKDVSTDKWPCKAWAVKGTPADCVKIAINELVKEPIDLVITGVNLGLNLGVAVVYSGTVGAAREAALWKVPAIALSIDKWTDEEELKVSNWIKEFIASVGFKKIKKGMYLNVNFPKAGEYSLAKTKVCEMGLEMYSDSYEKKGDSYILSGYKDSKNFEKSSDDYWNQEGFTTLVPLQIDQTSRENDFSVGEIILAN